MAITRDQAITEQEFHYKAKNADGTCMRYRRNGATQTWKTRPTEYRVPVKRGLYEYAQIRQYDADDFHAPSECPLTHALSSR